MEDENGLADIREVFPKKISTSESFDNDNKLTLKSFFAFCSLFFFEKRTSGRKMETTSRQSQCPVPNILQSRAKKS